MRVRYPLQDMHAYWRWYVWLDPLHYAWTALVLNQYDGSGILYNGETVRGRNQCKAHRYTDPELVSAHWSAVDSSTASQQQSLLSRKHGRVNHRRCGEARSTVHCSRV